MERRYHSTMHFHFSDFATAPVKLSLREELEIALEAAIGVQRNALAYNDGDMWARGWESQKEAEEQLVICDAVEFGDIHPLPEVPQRDAYSRPLQIEREDGTYTQEFDDYSDADPGL